MAKTAPTSSEDALQSGSGNLAALASGAWVALSGPFNIVLAGTWSGLVALEVSADGGTTVVPAQYSGGGAVTFSVPGHQVALGAVEQSMLYRLTRGDGTGTVAWRLSR